MRGACRDGCKPASGPSGPRRQRLAPIRLDRPLTPLCPMLVCAWMPAPVKSRLPSKGWAGFESDEERAHFAGSGLPSSPSFSITAVVRKRFLIQIRPDILLHQHAGSLYFQIFKSCTLITVPSPLRPRGRHHVNQSGKDRFKHVTLLGLSGARR